MGTAGFGPQVNALMRKNLAYQRRAVATNLCLLSAPIFFCLLLFIMQYLINTLLLNGPEFKCGCQCTSCCRTVNGVERCSVSQTYCPYTCRAFNETQCGTQYSTPRQAVRCEQAHPDSWPILMQTPKYGNRPGPDQTHISIPYTAKDKSTADKITRSMFPAPDLVKGFQDACAPSLLLQTVDTGGFPVIRGEAFSKLGFRLGTAVDPSVQIYKEAAFLGKSPLYFTAPLQFCRKQGFDPNTSYNITALAQKMLQSSTAVAGIVGAVSGSSNASSMRDVLEKLCPIKAVVQTLGAAQLMNNEFECAEALMTWQQSSKMMERQLYCGWFQARCNGLSEIKEYPGALDFSASSDKGLDLTLYMNMTDDGGGPSRAFFRMHELINEAVNAWLTSVALPGRKWRADLLGLQSLPKAAAKLRLDFSSLLGPLFYTWVVQMLLPTFLVQLVYEKEKRLRMMMKMHGLGDGAYWLVNYGWYLTLYIAYIIVFLVFGSAIRLKLFTLNRIGIQIIFYFLFGNTLIAFSYLLSCFFTSSRTAVVVALLWVFGTGLIGNLLLERFMARSPDWMFYVEWIPAFALYRGLYELSQYAFLGSYRNSPGMEFSNLGDKKNGMLAVWGIFVVETVLFAALAWYLEQVWSNGTGLHRHPLFFLGYKRREHASGTHKDASAVVVEVDRSGDDVAAEREKVAALQDYSQHYIVTDRLKKVYPAQDGGQPKVAVKDLTIAVEKGECFGLLGPNGAGKTSAINMMIGFMELSGGSVLVDGQDIKNHMTEIYKIMGVCPQHDLLWETLTGEEHLKFYGRLKGLTGKELDDAVATALKSVNLFNQGWGKVITRRYSGGMKRRLSVAISFIGQPKVVYLDEPSTGLDPASRRNLWEVVKRSKHDRSMILTTHSMEEAEVLCDRLGIFVDGRLACVGNPKEITSRYGGYYVFTLMVPPDLEEAAQKLVQGMSPGARLTYSVGGTLKYELPTADVSLSQVFRTMQSAKQGLQILDWGVANATLEEVFIRFARQVGVNMAD